MCDSACFSYKLFIHFSLSISKSVKLSEFKKSNKLFIAGQMLSAPHRLQIRLFYISRFHQIPTHTLKPSVAPSKVLISLDFLSAMQNMTCGFGSQRGILTRGTEIFQEDKISKSRCSKRKQLIRVILSIIVLAFIDVNL